MPRVVSAETREKIAAALRARWNAKPRPRWSATGRAAADIPRCVELPVTTTLPGAVRVLDKSGKVTRVLGTTSAAARDNTAGLCGHGTTNVFADLRRLFEDM